MSVVDNTKDNIKHIAIIMDGNGRWAKSRRLPRIMGHRAGAIALRNTVEAALNLGVEYLTAYSFSSENWNRPKEEITGLMGLLLEFLDSELGRLISNGVRLSVIGDRTKLPAEINRVLDKNCALTAESRKMQLTLALSYGGRAEIIDACRKIVSKVGAGELAAEDINENSFRSYLYDPALPDPELLIRTGGEERISNFLLWQVAYSEIVVLDKFWPDFGGNDLQAAIDEYRSRERRFGLLSEQLGGKSVPAIKHGRRA